MLKNLTVISGVALGTTVFSFHKMELYFELRHQGDKGFTYSSYPFKYWEEINSQYSPQSPIFFLHDKQNSCSLIHTISPYLKDEPGITIKDDLKTPDPSILKFLKGEFKYDEDFFSNQNIANLFHLHNQLEKTIELAGYTLVFKKQKLEFKSDGTTERKTTINSSNDIQSDIDDEYNDNKLFYVPLKKELKFLDSAILSDFEIINTPQGAILKGNEKEVYFTNVLKKYFVNNIENLNFQQFTEAYRSSPSSLSKNISKSGWDLTHDMYKLLSEEDYKLLQNSTILAIWHTSNKWPYTLVGLARDDNTKKQYHWSASLGRPFSVLLDCNSEPDNTK